MARSPAPVVTRRRLDPADRRAQIIDAAAGAFVARGFVATPIADVADRAGVTVRIVYRHFRSKDALYRAVLERTVARLGPVCEHPAGPYGIDTRSLLAAGRADIDGFRVLWRHAAREREFTDVVTTTRARLVACARAGLVSWTPEDVLDWSAVAVVGYQLEAVLTWLDHGRADQDERLVRATRAALRAGVRAWAAG